MVRRFSYITNESLLRRNCYCYFLMQCAQEICYQYWPGKSSETVKNGEFSVSMLEMVNRDGFVQRLISITDPKARHIHLIFMDLVHTLNQKQRAHLLTAWISSSSIVDAVPNFIVEK